MQPRLNLDRLVSMAIFTLEPYYDDALDRVRQDLLNYCHRDTLAMVRLVETVEAWPELLHDAADSG